MNNPPRKVPVICIVGRTNVGKSSLFNALVGARKAVIKDSPGVTRDRCYETVSRWGFAFTLIDTGALVGEESISLHKSVQEQTRIGMQEADLIIVVFDGLHGLHPQDADVFNLVREFEKPVIWVANKCEKPATALAAHELYALGISDLLCLSAAHRRGVRDLVAQIAERLEIDRSRQTTVSNDDETEEVLADDATEGTNTSAESVEEGEETSIDPTKPIKVAILGKPNVGKSSLVNKLLGEERLVVSPIAGTTRDSVSSEIRRDDRIFTFVDTAGLRKKAGVDDGSIERFSNLRALRTLAQSDVAVFVLDASEGIPTEQDARIVGLVHERGKGLVIVVNKWDLIEKEPRTAEGFRLAIRRVFKFVEYAPVIFVSAKTGQRCVSILDMVREVHDNSLLRIKTGELNRVLERAFNYKPPPVYRGAPVKLLYATQVGVAPPTITLFVNYPERLSFSYERYLKNALRRYYPFSGTDIKLVFRRRSQLAA
jgi:GTP-binding protein